MRLFLRAGIIVGMTVTAACNEAPTPVDFEDPAAVSANLASVDSTFDSDVFRSFSTATFMLDAATAPGIRPATTLLGALRPTLERTGGHVFLPGLLQAHKLQALMPNLSVSAAQGAIIPDSMYGRVFEWNETTDLYEYQGNTVSNLTGVRFVLYALGLDGTVFEPVSAIGTLDIIDESTSSGVRLHVLVKNTAGTTTYVDYAIDLQASQTSAQATASGTITNGLSGGSNKTLSFDEAFTVNSGGARVLATFALNNPAIALLLNESVTFNDPNLIVNADFRVVQGGQTTRVVGRIAVNTLTQDVDVNITVQVNGHPVASLRGDPNVPATQWVDAGGEPLTVADLAALDNLFDALEAFHQAIEGFIAPIGTFANL